MTPGERVYQLFLHLYPREFRQRYGRAMIERRFPRAVGSLDRHLADLVAVMGDAYPKLRADEKRITETLKAVNDAWDREDMVAMREKMQTAKA